MFNKHRQKLCRRLLTIHKMGTAEAGVVGHMLETKMLAIDPCYPRPSRLFVFWDSIKSNPFAALFPTPVRAAIGAAGVVAWHVRDVRTSKENRR